MFLVLWALVGGIGSWMMAEQKGLNREGWTLLGVIGGPLTLLILALMKPDEWRQVEQGRFRRCPKCAELIRPEAVKCRHCGTDV